MLVYGRGALNNCKSSQKLHTFDNNVTNYSTATEAFIVRIQTLYICLKIMASLAGQPG